MSLVSVTAATFDSEVKNASGPVVVKFYGKT